MMPIFSTKTVIRHEKRKLWLMNIALIVSLNLMLWSITASHSPSKVKVIG